MELPSEEDAKNLLENGRAGIDFFSSGSREVSLTMRWSRKTTTLKIPTFGWLLFVVLYPYARARNMFKKERQQHVSSESPAGHLRIHWRASGAAFS